MPASYRQSRRAADDQNVEKGEGWTPTLTVKIIYGGRPHTAVRAPWDGGFVWSQDARRVKSWVATAVQMEGCDLIWPCIDYPTYEPDKIDLHITVPARAESAIERQADQASSELPDGRSTWNWEARNPTLYGVALNVGPYEEVSGTYKSRFGNDDPDDTTGICRAKRIRRKSCSPNSPRRSISSKASSAPTPLADEKLGVVETPHKGMEHQTINAYGNNYAKTPWGFDDLFQHEFAHEWFANQLTAANWDDFWLHEGFAAYMQPLYGKVAARATASTPR